MKLLITRQSPGSNALYFPEVLHTPPAPPFAEPRPQSLGVSVWLYLTPRQHGARLESDG